MNIIKNLIFVIFLICAYLTTTKLPFFGNTFGKYFTLIKDIALILAIFCFAIIKVRSHRIRVDSINIILLSYMLALIFYTIISPLGASAVLGFLGFATAPILFFLLYNIQISNNTIYKITKIIFYYAIFHLTISLFIHLFLFDKFEQMMGINQYMQDSGIGVRNIYRYKNFEYIPRLIGLSIQPNEIGSLCIFALLFTSVIIKTRTFRFLIYLLLITTLHLTTARSPILGIIGAIAILKWTKIKNPPIKTMLLFGFILTLIFTIYLVNTNLELVFSYLDASAVVHLIHLLVEGPEAIIKYWFGLGIGMAGGLVNRLNTADMGLDGLWFESDHIMMIIQIGIVGFTLYLGAIFLIIKKIFIKDYFNSDTQIFNERSVLFFLSILIGGITFPLFASSRLISYIAWTFLALSIQTIRKEELSLKLQNNE